MFIPDPDLDFFTDVLCCLLIYYRYGLGVPIMVARIVAVYGPRTGPEGPRPRLDSKKEMQHF